MGRLRAVFMGSPEFAVPSLEALSSDPEIEVSLVVTQPDRRAGRGRTTHEPPVKVSATKQNIPVYQPETLKEPDAVRALGEERPDVIVVVSYGEILRRPVLELPEHGCLNVHPSLLPKYRGSTPIPATILEGDEETGISIIKLVRKMDAGPVVAQARTSLDGTETAGTLSDVLAGQAASLLPRAVSEWVNGMLDEQVQDEDQATYTRELRKADGQIDWSQPAIAIERFIRAMDPWPRAWTTLGADRLTVFQSRIVPEESTPALPGTIVIREGEVFVQTGDGAIELLEVQPAGKKRMPVAEWLRGARIAAGNAFASPEEPHPPIVFTR